MVRPAGLSGFSGQVVDITHVREYHGPMTSHQSEAGPIDPINEREREYLLKLRDMERDVPSPAAVPMWREFLVYTVDPSAIARPEEWHVWAGNVVAAQRAVLANLQLRRDDWVSEIVGTIETGESVYG